jgi:hypothetical protein
MTTVGGGPKYSDNTRRKAHPRSTVCMYNILALRLCTLSYKRQFLCLVNARGLHGVTVRLRVMRVPAGLFTTAYKIKAGSSITVRYYNENYSQQRCQCCNDTRLFKISISRLQVKPRIHLWPIIVESVWHLRLLTTQLIHSIQYRNFGSSVNWLAKFEIKIWSAQVLLKSTWIVVCTNKAMNSREGLFPSLIRKKLKAPKGLQVQDMPYSRYNTCQHPKNHIT